MYAREPAGPTDPRVNVRRKSGLFFIRVTAPLFLVVRQPNWRMSYRTTRQRYKFSANEINAACDSLSVTV